MTSSISNSKGFLVFRSLLVFMLLFICYNLAILIIKPSGKFQQNQLEKNISIADDFILESNSNEIIIVGSSLAARLEEKDLGSQFLNLSFAGGTSATGLELIYRSGKKPNLVLVETNTLRNLDTVFLQERFNAVSLFFRRHLPSARSKYQPVNILVGTLKGKQNIETVTLDSNVFQKLLADQRNSFNKEPNLTFIDHSLDVLSEKVEYLTSRGIRVVFFTMPIHSELESSKSFRITLDEFKHSFPSSKFLWIDSIPGDYKTADGLHLLPQSAKIYSEQLIKKLQLLGLVRT